MPKKTEREDPSEFFNIILLQNSKKNEGGPFRGKKIEKSRTVPKKI